MRLKELFWAVFAVIAGCAVGFGWHDRIFDLSGAMAAGKVTVWVVFVVFLGYSVYCSWKEDLIGTLGKIAALHWGRQIGIDLCLGWCLTLFIVYLNEGSLLVAALWLVPTFTFGNLATLLYFSIHFDSIVAKFLG